LPDIDVDMVTGADGSGVATVVVSGTD